MNKLQKNDIYDRLSKILAEHDDRRMIPDFFREDPIYDYREMLEEIHNKWGELTNEEN